MKTYRRITICVAMLIASLNLMAQRETMVFNGTVNNFPQGGSAEVTLTINPTGIFVFEVKGSPMVDAFTIKGVQPADAFYSLGGGVKAAGYSWALRITEWTAFDTHINNNTATYRPAGEMGTVLGTVVGTTQNDEITLLLTLRALLPGSDMAFSMPLQCKLKK